MPAPMTAPIPRVTRLTGPRARVRACSPLASASARRTAMGLVAKRDIPQSGDPLFRETAMWDGWDSGRDERDLGPHPLSQSPCGRGGTRDFAVAAAGAGVESHSS